MQIQESGQMYLESILVLSKKLEHVRSIDICEHMNYSKPSVSRAVGLLKNGGFITVDGKGYIYLTEAGNELANKIYERHTIITKVLTAIGVDEQIASQDACRIEHVLSDESFEAIKNHMLQYGKKS